MSVILSNTAVINNYTYTIAPSISGNAASNQANVDITILQEAVLFTKSTSPNYVTLNNTVRITYSVANIDLPEISAITITDAILTATGITPLSYEGCTIQGDQLIFVLSPMSSIPTGMTASASVTIHIGSNAIPSSTSYNTTAIASLTLLTAPESTIERTATDHFEVNAAIVTIKKTTTPSLHVITEGNAVTFTIEMINTGNVDAFVAIGQFSDSWSPDTLINVSCPYTNYQITGNTITNRLDLILPPSSSEIFSYSGIASAASTSFKPT